MELFGRTLILGLVLSPSESTSKGTISCLFSFSEFDSFILSPNFLVDLLTSSNFLVIGDNDSATFISCVCFKILFLILSAR